ncbi:MAG: anti-sigma F factor [Oscillospiraceae bacterium]
MKKVLINESRVSFPSLSRNEGYARSAAAAFIAQADPTVEELAAIKTAVSEAVTNAIVHGYRDMVGVVELTLRLYGDGVVYIAVKDKGRGIPDVDKALQPMYTTAPADEERSGLGFTVMESFMDRLRGRSAVGKGTTVTMERRLNVREKQLDKR